MVAGARTLMWCSRALRILAAPRSMATCASCPHACIFPGFLLLCSHSTASWNKQSKARERVVSQQRSAGPNLERQLAVPSSLQKSGIWRGAKPLLLPNTHEQTNGDRSVSVRA